MDRTNVWAPVGIDISNATSITGALDQSGLNYDVVKKPLFDENGKEINGFFGTQRSDNGMWLGQVGNRYTIVQNRDGFDFIDNLVPEGAYFEKAGDWKYGTAVWVEMRLPGQYKILGDDVESHVLFINSHDGKGAVKSCLLPTRIACANQINFALKSAARSISIIHSTKADAKLKASRSVLISGDEYMKELNKKCEDLAIKKVSLHDWNEFINAQYPLDPADSNRKQNNIKEIREAINTAINQPDLDNFKGTAYGYLQGMADYTSHRESGRMTNEYFGARLRTVANGSPELDAAFTFLNAA